ncbi:MAG: hypothetical protein R3E65_08335 [Steroidobacteraceae bacterium]
MMPIRPLTQTSAISTIPDCDTTSSSQRPVQQLRPGAEHVGIRLQEGDRRIEQQPGGAAAQRPEHDEQCHEQGFHPQDDTTGGRAVPAGNSAQAVNTCLSIRAASRCDILDPR